MKPLQKKDMAYTLFCWVFAAVFAGIWLGSVVNNRTSYYQYRVLPIVVCGAAALLVLAAFPGTPAPVDEAAHSAVK